MSFTKFLKSAFSQQTRYENLVGELLEELGVAFQDSQKTCFGIDALLSVPAKFECDESASQYMVMSLKAPLIGIEVTTLELTEKGREIVSHATPDGINKKSDEIYKHFRGDLNIQHAITLAESVKYPMEEINAAAHHLTPESRRTFIETLKQKGYEAPSYWYGNKVVFVDGGFMGIESPIDIELGYLERRTYLLEMDNQQFRQAFEAIRREAKITDKAGAKLAA